MYHSSLQGYGLEGYKRMLSGLNYHRFKHKFIETSKCPKCSCNKEDEEHFFLVCPALAAHRKIILEGMGELLPQHINKFDNINQKKNRIFVTKLVLYGTNVKDTDVKLFSIVSHFICNSNRYVTNRWNYSTFNSLAAVTYVCMFNICIIMYVIVR